MEAEGSVGAEIGFAAAFPDPVSTPVNAVAGHLQKTLEELKVKKELIDQVMAIAASTRNDVLNRPKTGK